MRARILVVEDDALVAFDLAHSLNQAGFAVVGPAPSVATALGLIAEDGCEAAVLDIRLRQETSERIAEELRARGIPFVTLTGFSNGQQPAAFMGAPLLSKPILPEQVVSAVRRSLEERR